MSAPELCFLTATELVRRVEAKEVSAREVVEAHLAQIERVNPRVNAIVTLAAEQAMIQARAADESKSRGERRGALQGLPIAHKDLILTKGIRTTFGSKVLENFVPKRDALMVERLRKAGAITIGKTNTPEFGAGSQTYNDVFGETKNPYDLTKTCGGSSGGAAVALACGLVPIADGSDLGGSLRNPASFCNVVGLRPSPGRVPAYPEQSAWFPLSVVGPMARTVADVALLLSVMAGPDPRSPGSIAEPGERFAASLERDFSGTRVAWSRDLGGLPMDPRVNAVLEAQHSVFEALGCTIDAAEPDLRDADECFKVWRAWYFELALGGLLDTHRDVLNPSVVWNIEQGRKLTGPQLGRAEVKRTALYHRVRSFLGDFAYLICPVSQVPPFDIGVRYPTRIGDVEMETYLDWMKSCYFITVTGLPAISVPCGFTPEGLPVGVQIVGRPGDDFGVLQIAHAFEQATEFWRRRPAIA